MTENLENDIELARRQLKEDLEKREREAQESIGKILSTQSMEFCSRCNRKVDDRYEWAGKCLHKECNNLICDSCWSAESKRYCSIHHEEALGAEKDGKTKTFFRPEIEDLPESKKEDSFSDSDRDKVTLLLGEYIEFMKRRLSNWAPDWNTQGWIDNAKAQTTGKENGFEMTIFSKKIFSKKEKLKIYVRPVYGKGPEDIDFTLSTIKEEGSIYHIFVLIGKDCDAKALEFVDTFNRQNASLFLVEPEKQLMFMDEKPLTKLYFPWVDQSKSPKQLKDILRGLVKEKVSGRDVITSKTIAESFGFSEQDAFIFLNSCKFLKHVEETDTFYFVNKE